MRVLVTGAANPFGRAIVERLLADGHAVRVFAIDHEAARQLGDVQWHPGSLTIGGSIEPVLSEREVLVHAACMDPPGDDKKAHAVHIERGTLYSRYGAEREQVDHFIHVTPAEPPRRFAAAHRHALATAEDTHGVVHVAIVRATSPEQAASAVASAISLQGRLGKQPGRETDAVTA